MIIYLDGPEKAGKSTLAKKIGKGFRQNYFNVQKWNDRDPQKGFGYLPKFNKQLNSTKINVWDRGWVSEVVYGSLLQEEEERLFAVDPFLCEWTYGRPLVGRGGRFIVLPSNFMELFKLRDHTDLEVDVVDEFSTYRKHAREYGYTILENDYDHSSLMANAVTARKSALVPIHTIPKSDYLGPRYPKITFIHGNDSLISHEFSNHFLDEESKANFQFVDLFRNFGGKAITDFGYSTTQAFYRNKDKYPRLFKNTIFIGPKNQAPQGTKYIEMATMGRATNDDGIFFRRAVQRRFLNG